MEHMNFISCKADPDVWVQEAVKETDGTPYLEYVLLYVDGAVCISMGPKYVLEKEIVKYLTLKKGSLVTPTIYLGN